MLAICSSRIILAQETRITITVSIPPESFFVKQIGGDKVEVYTLIKKGASPHSFDPTPKDIANLSESKIFFKIGLPFEKQLLKKIAAGNAQLKIVNIGDGIPLRYLANDKHANEKHEASNEISKGNADPHIWLNPLFVKIQATKIADALIEIDPENASFYKTNLENFLNMLNETNNNIQEQLSQFNGRAIYVYHPAFGYFTDAYGLNQIAIQHEGKAPAAKDLIAVIDDLKKNHVNTIFVDPLFYGQQAKMIANSLNAKLQVIDPLSEDYIQNLKFIAQQIKDSLK